MKYSFFFVMIIISVLTVPNLIIEGTSIDNKIKDELLSIYYLAIDDLNWTVGAFSCNDTTLNYLSIEGFEFSISDFIHFREVGDGTYYPVGSDSYVAVGAYATVSVDNDTLTPFSMLSKMLISLSLDSRSPLPLVEVVNSFT